MVLISVKIIFKTLKLKKKKNLTPIFFFPFLMVATPNTNLHFPLLTATFPTTHLHLPLSHGSHIHIPNLPAHFSSPILHPFPLPLPHSCRICATTSTTPTSIFVLHRIASLCYRGEPASCPAIKRQFLATVVSP